MSSVRYFLIILLALLCAARGEPGRAVSPSGDPAFLDWYDRLPLIDIQNLQPIRFWTGSATTDADGNSTPLSWLGFLKQDDGAQFRAITAFDSEQTYVKKGESPGDRPYVGYRKVNLGEELRRLLPGLASAFEGDFWERNAGIYSFGGLDRAAQLFLLTRWCAKHGDADLLDSVRPVLSSLFIGSSAGSVEDRLYKEFTAQLRWRALCAFGEGSETRPELLAKFRQIVSLCPKADLGTEKAAIAILERMIREDAEHTALSAEQLAALPPADQAKEWVFRLRDERGEKPFATGVVAGEEWPSNGAAQALAKLGVAALPALEAALDDDSFTREPPFPWTRNDVLRVRDFALKVLGKLSGCDFDPPTVKGQSVAEQREARFPGARAWARGVYEKGEKNYLVDEVRNGGPLAVKFAVRLLDLAPDDAIPVLLESVKSGRSPQNRRELALLLWSRRDPHCVDLFAGQLQAAEFSDRATAAYILRELKDSRAVPAMIAEWRRIRAECEKSGWPEFEPGNALLWGKLGDLNDPSFVANFLADSSAIEAVLALGEGTTDLSPEWRAGIISLFLPKFTFGRQNASKPLASGTKKAVEDLLSGFLTDREPVTQDSARFFWVHDSPIVTARVCDLAALALHILWPDKYAFNRWLPPAARTTQCIQAANVRLKELGEPLLSVPEKDEPVAPDEAAARRIVSVRSEPAVIEQIRDLVTKLSTLCGTVMSSDEVISAMTAFAGMPTANMRRVTLYISRFSDLSGISILVEFTPDPPAEAVERTRRQLNVWASFEKGAPKHPQFSTGGQVRDFANPAHWNALRQALDNALEAKDSAFAIVATYDFW